MKLTSGLFAVIAQGRVRWLVSAESAPEAIDIARPLAHIGGITGTLTAREAGEAEAARYHEASRSWSGEVALAALPV
jgi:hypothetical protein